MVCAARDIMVNSDIYLFFSYSDYGIHHVLCESYLVDLSSTLIIVVRRKVQMFFSLLLLFLVLSALIQTSFHINLLFLHSILYSKASILLQLLYKCSQCVVMYCRRLRLYLSSLYLNWPCGYTYNVLR